MLFLRAFGIMIWLFSTLPLENSCENTELIYDDFCDQGSSYFNKWTLPYYGIAGETFVSEGGVLELSFLHQRLKVSAPKFCWSSDYRDLDHIKYLAESTQHFPIPEEGSILFSSLMKAYVFSTYPAVNVSAYSLTNNDGVKYKIEKGRQAGAILRMSNAHETGQVFDWVVYGDQAFALTERLFNAPIYPANIDTAYTQVVKTFKLSSKPHHFAIRYSRHLKTLSDQVEYLVDGKIKAVIKNIGIPLDKQTGYYTRKDKVIDPSQGPGEPLIQKMSSMVIGHGLFTRVDSFPYQQSTPNDRNVIIPLKGSIITHTSKSPTVFSRIWGQGAAGFYYNFKVETSN